jgi:probable rRNA maturation factor
MSELYVRNRQRTRRIDLKLLKGIAARLVGQTCPQDYHIGIILVAAPEMTRLNEAFLQHAGSTDVIAFGYSAERQRSLHGEVFICVDEAIKQAQRFRTSWQRELVRYLAHGLLHFQGYEDSTPVKRARMKTAENALLAALNREFCLSDLSRPPKLRA